MKLLKAKTRWNKVKPFLETEECNKLLDSVVYNHCFGRFRFFKLETPRLLALSNLDRFVKNGRELWWVCSHDGVFEYRRPTKLSPRMYTLMGGCHSCVKLYIKFARIAYPEIKWRIFYGRFHSTVVGWDRKDKTDREPDYVYDLIGEHFKMTAEEIYEWATNLEVDTCHLADK